MRVHVHTSAWPFTFAWSYRLGFTPSLPD